MLAGLLALVLASSAAGDGGRATLPLELSVDLGVVLNDTRRRPTGINVDFLMDDDRNPLLSPRRDLVQALRELAPSYLRYPGGWKSAINLWSTPPFTSSRPVPAGRVPEDWVRRGLGLVSPDGRWRLDPLDFDEFMDTCRAVGCEPILVTAYESCYWPPSRGWTPPSREKLVETAAAWVRYANKVKGHAVRCWEVGNESYLNNETWTNRIPAETYAADLVQFSRRMKAEDASIRIGANGDTEAWWQVVLGRAADHVDFLSVHTYPCWKWTSYEQYRTSSPDALAGVRAATRAIARYAPAHAGRLFVLVTEFAAGTFGEWDEAPADLGRALMTFELQGQLLQAREVRASQFWTTHNVYTDVDGGVFDALMHDNSLSPIGRALWIWNRFLGDEMVAATSSGDVRCFASQRRAGQLALFLVNKDTSERDVSVALKRTPRPLGRGERWVLRGSGPSDRRPVWAPGVPVEVSASRVLARLDPVSITVIVLEPGRRAHQP
ncbi:MAG TPA: hypothetical protein VLL75_08795 [Vicinamibacteria bacterium]|nr:hypothetical protein [Vicinamibacteria bacterium]